MWPFTRAYTRTSIPPNEAIHCVPHWTCLYLCFHIIIIIFIVKCERISVSNHSCVYLILECLPNSPSIIFSNGIIAYTHQFHLMSSMRWYFGWRFQFACARVWTYIKSKNHSHTLIVTLKIKLEAPKYIRAHDVSLNSVYLFSMRTVYDLITYKLNGFQRNTF